MKIFDRSSIREPNNEKRGKGQKDSVPRITLNRSLKRISFNTCAFESLELLDRGVRFELEDNGTWYVVPDASERGIWLSAHRGVYYFKAIALIRSMIPDSRQFTATFVLVKEGERWRIEAQEEQRQTIPKSDDLASDGSQKPDGLQLKNIKKVARMVLDNYSQTDFPGRVKTLQVISSERILGIRR